MSTCSVCSPRHGPPRVISQSVSEKWTGSPSTRTAPIFECFTVGQSPKSAVVGSASMRSAGFATGATGTFTLYGKSSVKRYKTFVATRRPAGGAIRVVLVDEPKGWVAFFCSDPTAGVADILGNVAGDDTLLVVCAEHVDGAKVAAELAALAGL